MGTEPESTAAAQAREEYRVAEDAFTHAYAGIAEAEERAAQANRAASDALKRWEAIKASDAALPLPVSREEPNP